MSARSSAAFDTRGRRDAQASEIIGAYIRDIPKAALAVVAVYLALALDEAQGFDGARERFRAEWTTLYQNGILDVPLPECLK